MAGSPPTSFEGFQHAGTSQPTLSPTSTSTTNSSISTLTKASSALLAATSSVSTVNANGTDTVSVVDASTTSDLPVQITNSFSLAACIAVLIVYFILRRKFKRIMERPSLVLAVSMAVADGLLHTINLFGYTQLPHNFICAFFGGFLYAFPTLTSLFYSFCLALNTQLVFVFSKRPGNSTLKYYVAVPILLSLCICIPALAVGAYGYDASYDLCWYSWNGSGSHKIFIRYFFTFGLWCLGTFLYLVLAAITIIHAVFAKSSKINQLATNLSKSLASTGSGANEDHQISERYNTRSSHEPPRPSYQIPRVIVSKHDPGSESLKSEFESEPPTPNTPGMNFFKRSSQSPYRTTTTRTQPRAPNTTLSRRSMAMRALAFRLLGYILIPTVCILPSVVEDVISKTYPNVAADIPDRVTTMFATLNGLVGLFNAILFAADPALLALYHIMRSRRQEKGGERGFVGVEGMQEGEQGRSMDFEMADTRTGFSVYASPETPSHDPKNLGIAHQENSLELGNGTNVEVKKGRALSPIFMGHGPFFMGRSRRGNSIVGNVTRGGTGVVIRVDVQVENDGDRDLEKLERYLGGM